TGLTWGNLSSHVSKLEEENLLDVEKKFVNKSPKTILHLTEKGRKAFNEYRKKMNNLLGDISS
ncbi:MAG: transcriptional regulator, partial [Promethearchaeota archaeon]